MGNQLKAVFVFGSVAANMAKPESDIDILIVCRDNEVAKTAMEEMPGKFLSNKMAPRVMETGYFEDVSLAKSEAGRPNLDGAIPIFGKDYALRHQKCWRLPSRRTIIQRYLNPKSERFRLNPRKRFAFQRPR
jgi:predicted nucleotidyltransferase